MRKIDAINKIENSIYLNNEQKKVSISIINSLNREQDILSYFSFIMAKSDFKFNLSPKPLKGNATILNENKFKLVDINNNLNKNKLIIGDKNYIFLKKLLITHEEKIDSIHIDPPNDINNGFLPSNKFIYKDKFSRQGWLNTMKERLLLARKLLSKNGVIFISVDNNDQAYLKILMDEIFGEKRFVSKNWKI